MSIRITCPECDTVMTLADSMSGKKVRCKSCDKIVSVPAASKKKVLAAGDDEEEEEGIQEEPKLQVKTKKQAEADADTEADDDQPRKKKKKKKKDKGSMGLIIGGVAVLVVLLLVGGGVGLVFLLKPSDQQKKGQQVAQVDGKKDGVDPGKANPNANGDGKGGQVVPPVQQQPVPKTNNAQFIPKIQEGPPVKKGVNGGLVGNIRSAAYVTERKNDLAQIGKAYVQYGLEFNANQRNKANFLDYIKTFGPIHQSVKEGYIAVNLKADPLATSDIIAYEVEPYNQGYLCVMGGGAVDFVTEANWKAALGK